MKDSPNQFDAFPWDKLFPDILWILFWFVLLLYNRRLIKIAINGLLNRLKHGAGIKIGSFELESLKVTQENNFKNFNFQVSDDINNQHANERLAIYKNQRFVMPVHKIFKSQKEGQLYDVLIYMLPHGNNNLIQVVSVEYSFGKSWDNKIFQSNDRSNGFAISTSAYGPFVCIVKIHFNDNTSILLHRYIDFEMGDVASVAKAEE